MKGCRPNPLETASPSTMTNSLNSTRPPSAGFTLIELMIAVAIVAILAAVSLPGYTAYVQRGRLTEATSKLADHRTRLEQYFQDNRNYGPIATGCGVPVNASSSGYFTFNCVLTADPAATTQTDDQSYVVHAVGVGAMTGFEFTVSQSGAKQTRGFVGASGLPAACWLVRSSDRC
jgi:type IV pilus assembly protein PilE